MGFATLPFVAFSLSPRYLTVCFLGPRALQMAASSVEQGIFVPLQTCATLGVNMLTGLVIWEDWRVVTHWFAYIALYCIMGLGICEFSSMPSAASGETCPSLLRFSQSLPCAVAA